MNTNFSVTSNPSLISSSFYSAHVPAAALQTATGFTHTPSEFNPIEYSSTEISPGSYRAVADYTNTLLSNNSPNSPRTDGSPLMTIFTRTPAQLALGGELLTVGGGDGRISYMAIGDEKDDGIGGGTLPPIPPWEGEKDDVTITPPLPKRPKPVDIGDNAALIKILDHKDGTKGGANLATRYIIFNALMMNSTTSTLVRAITVLRTLNEYMIGPVTTLEGFKEMITKCIGYEQWFDEHGETVFRMLFSGQLVDFAYALRDAGRAKDAEALFSLIADIDTPFPSTEKDGSPIIDRSGERIKTMTVLTHGTELMFRRGSAIGRGRIDEKRVYSFERREQVRDETDGSYWTSWNGVDVEEYTEDTFMDGPPLEDINPRKFLRTTLQYGDVLAAQGSAEMARMRYASVLEIATRHSEFKMFMLLKAKINLLDLYDFVLAITTSDPALSDTKRMLLSNIASTASKLSEGATDTETVIRLHTVVKEFIDAVEERK